MDHGYPSLESIAEKHKETLQTIHNHAISRSQRAVNWVYNKDSRNISKFIREQKEFQRKSKGAPILFGQKQEGKKKKRFGVTLRYEDNETLELQYEPKETPEKTFETSVMGANLNTGSESSRQTAFKSSKVSFLSRPVKSFKVNLFPPNIKMKKAQSSVNPPSPTRQRSPTLLPGKGSSLRRRVKTHFDVISPRDDSFSQNQPKRQDSYPKKQVIIQVNRQKMERFIRNLHRVAWMSNFLRGQPQQAEKSDEFKEHMRQFSFDIDSSIHQSDLNYMISRRYYLLRYHLEDHYDKRRKQLDEHQSSVKRQVLASGEDYSLLDSLSKRSILTMINKKITEGKPKSNKSTITLQKEENEPEREVTFHLPYAQFISERQTRTSIYRLVSMSYLACLRIAFSLYDKNNNGKVDEDDLLQAISLSRKMPQLQPDILLIAEIMILQSKRSLSRAKIRKGVQRQHSQFIRSGGQKILVANNDQNSTVSFKRSEQLEEDSDDQDQEEKMAQNNQKKFSLDKFYVFLKQKNHNMHRKESTQQKPMNFLTFPAFCKAFRNRRPAILYDLFHFIFGAHKYDFTPEVQAEQKNSQQTDKKNAIVKTEHVQSTLQEKWNDRLLNTNRILQNLLKVSQQL